MDITLAAEALRRVMSPLGIETRLFIVDYRDERNNYFNHSLYASVPPHYTNKGIARQLISGFESQGYVVYAIIEVLDGYSREAIDKMPLKEYRKHTRPIYLDIRKERNRG